MLWRALAIASVAAAAVAIDTLRAHNHFASLEPDLVGNCAPVRGIDGPEDLQADPEGRRLFIASSDKQPGGTNRGGIHVLNIDDPLDDSGWRDRTGGKPEAFVPIGLSYFTDGAKSRLFVVNSAADSIELFDVDASGDLTHLRTFSERRLTSPNDVAALGPDDFVATNDASAGRASILGRLQFLGRAQAGAVLRFNGVAWSVVDEGLRFANGVAADAGGRRIFVGESAGKAVRMYERDEGGDLFRATGRVLLPGAAENLNIADDGALIVAANPKPLTVALHRRSVDAKSPSLIMRIDPADFAAGAEDTIETLFRSDGEVLSAATAGDAIGSTLFVGALADDRFLICKGAS